MSRRTIHLSYCLDCTADIRVVVRLANQLSRPMVCPVCGSKQILSALPGPAPRRADLVGYG